MPTATTTVTKVQPTQFSLKSRVTLSNPGPPVCANSTTKATLHTLYNRAARAFLLRDISLTHSLIDSAFGVLKPPHVVPDGLEDHRRKWDILRITLESTVFSSPPPSENSLPMQLQEDLLKSPQDLISTIYARSLTLFSPQSEKSFPNAFCLPPQVLITLIYSSIRVNCPDMGRLMIEEWLARRQETARVTPGAGATDVSYEKVLELYCLHVLPRLDQWDYARQFLSYEGELSPTTRQDFQASLKSLEAEMKSSRQKTFNNSSPPIDNLSRSCSPASSSSSSSLSTASTHTVVPATVRPSQQKRALVSTSNRTSKAPKSSSSSGSTATARVQKGARSVLRSRHSEQSHTSSSNNLASTSRSKSQAATLRTTNLSIYNIVKTALAPHLTASKIFSFLLIFFTIPLISFAIRARRRRNPWPKVSNNAAMARRHLQVDPSGRASILGKAWSVTIRAVSDTIKMAGSGLV